MATCTISGTVLDSGGSAISGAPVAFNIQQPILSADPVRGSTTTATDGTWSMALLQGLSGIFTISVALNSRSRAIPFNFNVNIPTSSTAAFSSIVVD